MATNNNSAVSLNIGYQEKHDKVSTFFRLILSIPILIILSLITSSDSSGYINEAGKQVSSSGGGVTTGLFMATVLMIVFQQRYPRWWFNFNLELTRFSARIGAYLLLLTDQYPSTEDKQSVDLEITYPNVKKDLNRWLPLVKWFLAIPNYFALIVLSIGVLISTLFAWLSILITGKYPKSIHDYILAVGRWSLRVQAYAFLLVTDEYPKFSLK